MAWTAVIVLLGVGTLLFSLQSANDSNIPITLSQALLMFCISISILLTASWKAVQLLLVRIFCRENPSRITPCLLSPGWALCFVFCSLSLAMLCTFGFITYPSTITFPFGVSLAFGIASFFLFVASTLGFNQYCGCCRVFIRIWQSISFWICLGFVIWDIVSDILAATKVYIHHDYHFFVISVTFSSITFSLYWIVGLILVCTEHKMYDTFFKASKKRFERFKTYWEWTLYVPILSMITITVYFPGSPLIALAFSSFPQYIISMSFILEHKVADFFNIMALIMSLIQLMSSPFFIATMSLFKLGFENDPDAKSNFAKMRTGQLAQMGFLWFLAYAMFFLPILTLEIIHFAPILFEYYMYGGLTRHDLVVYLLCFNIPKVLFIGITLDPGSGTYNAEAPQMAMKQMKEIWNESDVRQKCYGCSILSVGFIVYGLTFLVLPLIPVTMLCLGAVVMIGNKIKDVLKKTAEFAEIKSTAYMARSNLLILTVYLLIAYGGMGRMISFNKDIGEVSFWMLMLTWFLSLWIVLLPIFTPIYTVLLTSVTERLEKEDGKENAGAESARDNLGFVVKMAVRAIFCPCSLREHHMEKYRASLLSKELK